MIIILNGSVGSGKSTVSEELQVLFDKSVMLDGDYIGLIHPFEIYDDARIEYLYKTLLLLVEFHHSNGYNDFVINYVFESPESLKNLTNRLVTIIPEIHCFWLTCSEAETPRYGMGTQTIFQAQRHPATGIRRRLHRRADTDRRSRLRGSRSTHYGKN